MSLCRVWKTGQRPNGDSSDSRESDGQRTAVATTGHTEDTQRPRLKSNLSSQADSVTKSRLHWWISQRLHGAVNKSTNCWWRCANMSRIQNMASSARSHYRPRCRQSRLNTHCCYYASAHQHYSHAITFIKELLPPPYKTIRCLKLNTLTILKLMWLPFIYTLVHVAATGFAFYFPLPSHPLPFHSLFSRSLIFLAVPTPINPP